MQNSQRSNRLEAAIMGLRDDNDNDVHTTLVDLMADAMHWCDQNGDDFQIALAQAFRHYINELNDEQTDERRLS